MDSSQSLPPLVPVIETARLRLRGHKVSDFNSSFAMWSDPDVVKFISGVPSTESQAWLRVLTYIGHWSMMGFGYWLVEEKATYTFVGEVGFADFKRDLQPSIKGVPELGWALTSFAQGKGYATEAAQAALTWRDQNISGSTTVCLISPDNLASFRVAQKCGFIEKSQTTFAGRPTTLHSRDILKNKRPLILR